jgi:multimeric flavodoxin WrbA
MTGSSITGNAGPRILVVQGGGRPCGNTYLLCRSACEGVSRAGGIPAFVSLADRQISPCRGYACDACRNNGGRCVIEDDFIGVYQQVLESHGIILATPVYVGTLSAVLKAFMERFRAGSVGALFYGQVDPMRYKVGGALAVGVHAYGGQEFALQAMIDFFLAEEMIVVGGDTPHAYFGAAGESSTRDGVHPSPPDGLAGSAALVGAASVGARVTEVSRWVFEGKRRPR